MEKSETNKVIYIHEQNKDSIESQETVHGWKGNSPGKHMGFTLYAPEGMYAYSVIQQDLLHINIETG